jgi:hypothetical protein
MSESLETSVPWNKTIEMINLIRATLEEEAKKMNTIVHMSFRIAQSYDAGCCVYTYYQMPSSKDKLIKQADTVHRALRGVVVSVGGIDLHHWFPNFFRLTTHYNYCNYSLLCLSYT